MSRNPHFGKVETLLKAIVQAQSNFVSDESCHSGLEHVLHSLLKLTDSQYGFIGEVLTNDRENPFLKIHAISNRAWNEDTRKLSTRFAPNLQ